MPEGATKQRLQLDVRRLTMLANQLLDLERMRHTHALGGTAPVFAVDIVRLADDLMMRIYAAMAQKERELISARTKAALAAAKARGAVLGGEGGIGRRRVLTRLRRPGRGGRRRKGPRTGWRWRSSGSVTTVWRVWAPSRGP